MDNLDRVYVYIFWVWYILLKSGNLLKNIHMFSSKAHALFVPSVITPFIFHTPFLFSFTFVNLIDFILD